MPTDIAQNALLITSTRLGDAVLSTGMLAALHERHPGTRITVVCGPIPAPLFEACPFVDKVHVLKKKKWRAHWIDLWKIVWAKRWTVIVDLRNFALARFARTQSYSVFDHSIPGNIHKLVQYQRVLDLPVPPQPVLWGKGDASVLIPEDHKILALGPASNWHAKTWPAENFINLAQRLLSGPLQGWRLALFAAECERAQVQPILDAFPEAIDAVGWGNPAEVVAALQRCDLFIGNDSGLMHMAAAVGIKTLGLFGPTDERVYGPWNGVVVRTPESMKQLLDRPFYDSRSCPNLMKTLTVDAVEKAAATLVTG